MAQVINTNMMSLMAQNNLNKSQSALSTSIQRLSTGYRINSAKDDAAGQGIANRFSSQIRGLTQAARNANDGLSLTQTIEGGVNQINDNLQRIRELSVQALNGTNSNKDIGSIYKEIKDRVSEIKRIGDQVNFNGIDVLNKEQNFTFQVGANDRQTVVVEGVSMQLGDLKIVDKTNASSTGVDLTNGKDILSAFIRTFGKRPVDTDGTDIASQLTDLAGTAIVPANVTEFTDSDKERLLTSIDSSINIIDAYRGQLGATQNRFEAIVSELNGRISNLTASRSRIEDADYATEVSNMTRAQILQQAGTSVLSQANQVPQTVLSLLQS